MLQSASLPGTSTPPAMQEDGASPGMTVLSSQTRIRTPWRRLRCAAAAALVCAALAACTGEQFQKGYILPPGALEQIPIGRSEEHTSELQSRFGISYAVFC